MLQQDVQYKCPTHKMLLLPNNSGIGGQTTDVHFIGLVSTHKMLFVMYSRLKKI